MAFAIAWQPRPPLRLYGELGFAYLTRDANQQMGRWEGGVEYERRPRWLRDRAAWYAAADFAALQERDWRLDTALQTGLVARNHGRTYRFYLQWYDGLASARSVHPVFGGQPVGGLQDRSVGQPYRAGTIASPSLRSCQTSASW